MVGVSLAEFQCGDCGTLLKSIEDAEKHAELDRHTNFTESSEPMLYIVCTACGKPCRCKKECDLHTRRTGHRDFQDKTVEAAKEEERILLEAKKEEERRLLEHFRQQLEEVAKEQTKRREEELERLRQEGMEKIRQLLLPQQDPTPLEPLPVLEDSLPGTKEAEQMRNCLRTLKRNHIDDAAKVNSSFDALQRICRNVFSHPDDEKFRKIRLSNSSIQEKICKMKGGIEFLELCGFERMEGDEFLYLPREKADKEVLRSAGLELHNAMNNPAFGRF